MPKIRMHRKSEILSKAQALWEVGMTETAQPLWLSAATYEEYIAPMLDALGRELEGAIHRISAASCYEQVGHLSRAVNLYRAALSDPLREDKREEVENMLSEIVLKSLNTMILSLFSSVPSSSNGCDPPVSNHKRMDGL